MGKQELTDKSKLTRFELAFLIIAATVTITVVSTCSPLYPYNPWDDANCFFTLGRGIKHGLVPYRDLYEQKGPLLYFVYALAALISDRSFTGVWIIECIMASLFAIFSWKTAKLFVEPSKHAIFLMPLLLAFTYTTRLFNFGGNAEELCFPLLTIALYIGLKSIVKGNELPENREAVICGLITASLFWVKYTFIGFMIAFCIYILILSIKLKDIKKLWSLVWRFACGFLIPTVPILIYFIANRSLNSLWEAYFYNNIFLYHSVTVSSGPSSIPVFKNFYIPVYCMLAISSKNVAYGIMLVLSIFSLAFINKAHRLRSIIFFALTFALTVGTVFSRNSFIYYYLYITAYCFCLLLIPFIKAFNLISKAAKQSSGLFHGLVCGFLIACFALVLMQSKNTYLLFKDKNYLAQFRYAETINETPNAKILTYDVMDAGFFTAAGLLPQNRFYCYLNIERNYTAITEEQNRLISEGYFDYIITSYFNENKWDKYELIREETDTYVDFSGVKALDGYRLYKRK